MSAPRCASIEMPICMACQHKNVFAQNQIIWNWENEKWSAEGQGVVSGVYTIGALYLYCDVTWQPENFDIAHAFSRVGQGKKLG